MPLLLVLPEGAQKLVPICHVPKHRHQLRLALLLVLLGVFGLVGLGAVEFGGWLSAQVPTLLHLVPIEHKLELLIAQLDHLGTAYVRPLALHWIVQ